MNEENIRQLNTIRQLLSASKEDLQSKREIIDKQIEELNTEFNDENTILIQTIKNLSTEEEALKEIIKEESLNEYEQDKIKSRFGGIGVQERKGIEYDEKEAFEWAKTKMLCLQLDKKVFEKTAKNLEKEMAEQMGITFVKDIVKTIVTIPTTLKIED